MNSFIILPDGISAVIDFKPFNISSSHPNYDEIVEALKRDDFEAVEELYNVGFLIQRQVEGTEISIDTNEGVVKFRESTLHGSIVTRILTMVDQGFSLKPLNNFLTRLYRNPSLKAVEELYGFLEYGGMPITEDGCFLAYKRVRSDYKSVHDGKTDNSIGSRPSMNRNEVDDQSDNTCSRGLHFCSHEYLSNFSGDKVVVLKVDPEHVVSIPTDYNNTKGRACEYLVVGELSPDEVQKALTGSMFEQSVNGDYSDYDDRDWLDDNDDEFHEEDCEDADYRIGYDDGYQFFTEGNRRGDYGFNGPSGSAAYVDGWEDGYRDANFDY